MGVHRPFTADRSSTVGSVGWLHSGKPWFRSSYVNNETAPSRDWTWSTTRHTKAMTAVAAVKTASSPRVKAMPLPQAQAQNTDMLSLSVSASSRAGLRCAVRRAPNSEIRWPLALAQKKTLLDRFDRCTRVLRCRPSIISCDRVFDTLNWQMPRARSECYCKLPSKAIRGYPILGS